MPQAIAEPVFISDYVKLYRKLNAIIAKRVGLVFECLNCGTRYHERATETPHDCPKCGRNVVSRTLGA